MATNSIMISRHSRLMIKFLKCPSIATVSPRPGLIPLRSAFRSMPLQLRMACQNGAEEKKKICTGDSQASSPFGLPFWSSQSTWRRASINTLRCLVGCTAGDFSAMWYLQATQPELGMGTIMAISSMFELHLNPISGLESPDLDYHTIDRC